MIPARGHYEARFTRTNGHGTACEIGAPVEAFDEDGHALILDWRTGKLVAAINQAGFIRVDPGSQHVAGVVPGGGWKIAYTADQGGTQWTEDVVAWTVNSAGNAVPLTVQDDDHLVAEQAIEVSNGRLIPPGGIDPGSVTP